MSSRFHRSFCSIVAVVAVAVSMVLAPSDAGAVDDPALDYYTITTPHFYVHYYEGLEDIARRAAVAAEESHEVLSPLLDWEPDGRTHMLVTDESDRANGFARVFGRNFITIWAKPPTPENNLGYYDDWLRVLVYHEYVHILHLDTHPGITRHINRVIGKQYHPNSALPRWYIEGIAVHLETQKTGRGRTNSPIYRMWLRTAALDDDLFSLGRATGMPRKWPGGTGPYLYGAFFLDHIVEHHGNEYIRDFNHRYGTRLIPYALNKITDDITDSPLEEHWEEFIAASKAEAAAKKAAVQSAGQTQLELLTAGGGRNRYPVVRPQSGGQITFHRADLTTRPVYTDLMRSGEQTDPVRDARGVAGSPSWCPEGETLYFSRSDVEKNVYNYQDLFAYTPRTGRMTRLTTSDRAREPDISPDGEKMVYVRNRAGSMELVERPLQNLDDQRVLVGRDDWPPEEDGHWQQISQPVYTPEGDAVVFSWWRLDRRQRDLFMVDLETGEVEQLTDSPAHDIDPHFGPDGLLYFASDVDDIFNIHVMDIDTGEIWQVSNVVRGVFHPTVSEDRQWIYVYTYTHQGFEIARFRHPQRFHHADRREAERTNPRVDYPEIDLDDIGEPQDYNPWRWMAPMFFTPEGALAAGGGAIGGTISGYDPVEHHEYSLSGGLTTGPEFTDRGASLGLTYRYTGGAFDVTSRLRFRDVPRDQDLIAESRYIPFVERQYLGELRLAYPIRSRDHRFRLGAGYEVDYRTDSVRPEVVHEPDDIRPREPELGFFNSVSLSMNYSNLHRYPHSVSAERGVSISTGVSLHHPALGSPDSAITFNYGGDAYYSNPFVKRHVFALRTRGAIHRDGDGRVRRYAVGGQSPHDVINAVLFQEPRGGFPLRGYPPGVLRGSQYNISKLEYRFPIIDMERGFGTTPLFLRNIKGMVFTDAGTAFDGHLFDANFRTSVGAEVQLDTVVGYYLSNSLRLGYARGLDDEDGISDWYLLFGGSF